MLAMMALTYSYQFLDILCHCLMQSSMRSLKEQQLTQ